MTEFDDRLEESLPTVDFSSQLADMFRETPVEHLRGMIAAPDSPLTRQRQSEEAIDAVIWEAFKQSGLTEVELWERSSRLAEIMHLPTISLYELQAVLSGDVDASDTHPWYTIAQVLDVSYVGGL